MKLVEKILSICTVMSIISRFFQLPFASILIGVSISVLACFYIFFSFPFFYEIPLRNSSITYPFLSTNKVKNIGVISSGFAMALGLIGILYKLQLYQDSSFDILKGSTILAIFEII